MKLSEIRERSAERHHIGLENTAYLLSLIDRAREIISDEHDSGYWHIETRDNAISWLQEVEK